MTRTEYEAHLQAWRELCRRCRVGGALPIQFCAFACEYQSGAVEIQCTVQTTHRDGGHEQSHCLRCVVAGIPHIEKLRDLARDLYKHELREQFCVDGARVFDPHALDGADVLGDDASRACWESFCARAQVRGPLAVEFRIRDTASGTIDGWFVQTCVTVEPVRPIFALRPGFPDEFKMIQVLHSGALMHADRQRPSADYLLYQAEEIYLHELDEQFHVDGRRPFDPHRPVALRPGSLAFLDGF